MDGKQKTRVLFVRYQPGRSSSPSSNGEMSQQRHAAREYHRKAKERRRSTRKVEDATNDEALAQADPLVGSIRKAVLPLSKSNQALGPFPARALGGGRVDPFNSYTVKDLSPHAHQMLDYSLTYQWPLFSFANPGATVEDMKRHVMGRIMFSATSLYAVVFVGATHWALSQYGREVPKENAMLRLNYKNSALKQLAADVQNIGPNVPNETLYTMMALAAFGRSGEKLKPPPYRPNQSGLATAHELEFYSRLPVEWAHLRALFHIIKERGGLPAIARPGFALITSFYDILTSCQRLVVPTFPPLESTESLLSTWPPAQTRTPLSCTLGSGFNGLSNEATYLRLCTVIDHVVQITLGYDRYEGRSSDAPILYHVICARSAVIHDLLSLPNSIGDVVTPDSIIYEISRLGSLAYMLISLYPIAPANGPHEELARRLHGLLGHTSGLGMWDTHLPLLLWAVVLGGIMAKEFTLRCCYVQYLCSSGLKDTFPTWSAVSTIMTDFLWHKSGCDGKGKELWEESWDITQLRTVSV
ncbi:hypothetical protein DV737_g4534, partial [Chaetothyriales sp. CBS 132003]